MTLSRVPTYRGRRPSNTGPSASVRGEVMARCQGNCERCGGWLTAYNIHHRRPRAMGGTNRPETNEHANLVVVCTWCHGLVEAHRAEALEEGWLVSQNSDPATVPVLLHRERFVYLTATGYSDNPPEVA